MLHSPRVNFKINKETACEDRNCIEVTQYRVQYGGDESFDLITARNHLISPITICHSLYQGVKNLRLCNINS
jgi:hypothetical protein